MTEAGVKPLTTEEKSKALERKKEFTHGVSYFIEKHRDARDGSRQNRRQCSKNHLLHPSMCVQWIQTITRKLVSIFVPTK